MRGVLIRYVWWIPQLTGLGKPVRLRKVSWQPVMSQGKRPSGNAQRSQPRWRATNRSASPGPKRHRIHRPRTFRSKPLTLGDASACAVEFKCGGTCQRRCCEAMGRGRSSDFVVQTADLYQLRLAPLLCDFPHGDLSQDRLRLLSPNRGANHGLCLWHHSRNPRLD